jgi:hypothetical protein
MQADTAVIVDGAVRAALNERQTNGSKVATATRFGGCGALGNLDELAGLARW